MAKKLSASKIVVFCFILLTTYTSCLVPVKAAGTSFNVDISREYTLENSREIKVLEIHKVTNNSENLLISKNNTETFQISVVNNEENRLDRTLGTVKVTVDGTDILYNKTLTQTAAEITVDYPREVRRGQTIEFRMEYTNYGLSESTGGLVDVYAPGFADDFQFTSEQTQISYTTKVKIADSFEEENLVVPEPAAKGTLDGYRYYDFSQESLVGNTVWIQLGKMQYYNFQITQEVIATDDKNTGYFNEYRVIIPRDIEEGRIEQRVYFEEISPDPYQVKQDEEGNLIGFFRIASHEDAKIVLKGHAIVAIKNTEINSSNSGRADSVPAAMLQKYTQAAQYWEVGNPEITALAADLRGNKTNVFKIAANTYKYIVDTIDYSQIKRFGLNQRQGALKTLQGGAAVCMEYSDLFLTLTRAQGIPARAVFGYGYDSKLAENRQEPHQWVQIFMPKLNQWVSVDVTWGETGPELIGGDLNHFYTHVAAKDPNTPSMIERISYGKDVELKAPEFEILIPEVAPDVTGTKTQADLLRLYPSNGDDGEQNAATAFFNKLSKFTDTLEFGTILVLVGSLLGGISLLSLTYMLIATYREHKHKK